MGLKDDNAAVADPCSIGDFALEGLVEGTVVRATRRQGRLFADASLLDRASVLVAMGEVFSDADTGIALPAGLGEAVQAVLTLVRAADRVTSLRLQLGDDRSLAYRLTDRLCLG